MSDPHRQLAAARPAAAVTRTRLARCARCGHVRAYRKTRHRRLANLPPCFCGSFRHHLAVVANTTPRARQPAALAPATNSDAPAASSQRRRRRGPLALVSFALLLGLALLALAAAAASGQCPGGVCPLPGPAATPASSQSPPAARRKIPVARLFRAGDRSPASAVLVDVDDSGRGLLLTCRHVAEWAADRPVTVLWATGRNGPADLLAVDAEADLAVYQTETLPDCPPVDLADVPPAPGSPVEIAGWGQGRWNNRKGRVLGYSPNRDAVHVSAAAVDGDSGGAIVDQAGRLVAILWGTNDQERQSVGTTVGPIRRLLAGLPASIDAAALADLTPPVDVDLGQPAVDRPPPAASIDAEPDRRSDDLAARFERLDRSLDAVLTLAESNADDLAKIHRNDNQKGPPDGPLPKPDASHDTTHDQAAAKGPGVGSETASAADTEPAPQPLFDARAGRPGGELHGAPGPAPGPVATTAAAVEEDRRDARVEGDVDALAAAAVARLLPYAWGAVGLGGLTPAALAAWGALRLLARVRRRRRRTAPPDPSSRPAAATPASSPAATDDAVDSDPAEPAAEAGRPFCPAERSTEEARQLLRLSELEGRSPLHDAIVGRFTFDALDRTIDADPTGPAADYARRIRRELEDRFNEVAPLAVYTPSPSTN